MRADGVGPAAPVALAIVGLLTFALVARRGATSRARQDEG